LLLPFILSTSLAHVHSVLQDMAHFFQYPEKQSSSTAAVTNNDVPHGKALLIASNTDGDSNHFSGSNLKD
jgi:hypothetical protein